MHVTRAARKCTLYCALWLLFSECLLMKGKMTFATALYVDDDSLFDPNDDSAEITTSNQLPSNVASTSLDIVKDHTSLEKLHIKNESSFNTDSIKKRFLYAPNFKHHHRKRLYQRTDVPEAEEASKRDGGSHGDDHRTILGHCSITEKCKKGEYCDGMYCFACKAAGDHCDLNGECCDGSECQYGICSKGVKPGMPGTFCDLAKDCTGPDSCCIHEMSISEHHSVCKPMLEEHESCGPINLFHQDILRAHMEPVCGPCKPGLACKGVGILGRHSICLPENEE